MREHALDRKMGLAGVGGTQHGSNAAAWDTVMRALELRGGRERRKGHSLIWVRVPALSARLLRETRLDCAIHGASDHDHLSHIAPHIGSHLKLRNALRTNHEGISDSVRDQLRSPQHLGFGQDATTRSSFPRDHKEPFCDWNREYLERSRVESESMKSQTDFCHRRSGSNR